MNKASRSLAVALVTFLGFCGTAVHLQQLERKPASPDHWKALTGLSFKRLYASTEAHFERKWVPARFREMTRPINALKGRSS